VLLTLAILFCFVGYNAVETFFSSYGVSTLGVSESTASMVLSVAYVAFIALASPSGFVGTRLGRRRTILIGLIAFAVVLAIPFFVSAVQAVIALLAVGGVAWAQVNTSDYQT
jgi:MFS family permease